MKERQNKLRYSLECDGYGTRDVVPLGESTFSISFELQNEDTEALYKYGVKFSGSLIFVEDDFQWIYGAESGGFRCTDMIIHIYSDGCGDEFMEMISGTKINLSKGNWDLSKCKVVIPVISTDSYECYNLNKADKVNIFSIGGGGTAVRIYDYTPQFEYNFTLFESPSFATTAQDFSNYANRRAEYPGFGCEGELEEPYYPESDTTLFQLPSSGPASCDLKNLVRNPVTYEEILSTGAIPLHSDYMGVGQSAFDAKNDGWRLYFSRYRILSSEGLLIMSYTARFRWVREVKFVPAGTLLPADWVFISTAGGTDKYARPPILMPRKRIYQPSFKNQDFLNFDCIVQEMSNYIVGRATVVVNPDDDSDKPNEGVPGNLGNVYGFVDLPNGVPLNDIITFTVGNACPGVMVKSEFFQINPDTPTTTNYVTGTTSFVDQIMIFQKTDVKRPWASEHATIGEITMEELFLALWYKFKVKYTIDNGVMRLEHISSPLLRKPATIDITAPPLNRLNAGKLVYAYNVNGLFAKETFSDMDQRPPATFLPTDDFAGLPITYDGNCVNREEGKNVLNRKIERITTDILYVLINGGGFSSQVIDNETGNKYTTYEDNNKNVIDDDGFCMVASRDVGGTRYGVSEAPILDSIQRFNNVLGWAHVHEHFYKTDANAETGTINGNPVTFDNTKPIKQQTTVSFKVCCIADFDPYEAIVGDFGTAIIKSATWHPQTQIMDADLLYRL